MLFMDKEYITTNTTWKISSYSNDVGMSDWLKGNVFDHGNQFLVIKPSYKQASQMSHQLNTKLENRTRQTITKITGLKWFNGST